MGLRDRSPSRPFRMRFLSRHRPVMVVAALALLVSDPPCGAAEPPALFLKACAPCHGKDGKAATPQGRKLGVKDMTLSTLDEAQIRQQIREGKKGPDGALRMPAFQDTLKVEEIERLARYARSLQVAPSTNRPAASAK